MVSQVYLPSIALQEFVISIITIDATLPNGLNEVVTPYPPAPLQSIIFYGDNPVEMHRIGQDKFSRQPPIVVIGPQYSRVNIKVARRLRAVRVDFHPGGLFRLLGIPMANLFDEGVDAVDVFGYEMKDLNEQIVNANDLKTAKCMVEKFLLNRRQSLKISLPLDYALSTLLKSNGNTSIDNIASLACLSLRQFERKCIERLGMPPKAFARIARFSRAYRLKESKPELTWTTIAHDAGYFDQMHLIRDFKEFAGVTPKIIERALSATPFRMQADLVI